VSVSLDEKIQFFDFHCSLTDFFYRSRHFIFGSNILTVFQDTIQDRCYDIFNPNFRNYFLKAWDFREKHFDMELAMPHYD